METRLERGRLSIIQSKGETLEGYPLPSSSLISQRVGRHYSLFRNRGKSLLRGELLSEITSGKFWKYFERKRLWRNISNDCMGNNETTFFQRKKILRKFIIWNGFNEFYFNRRYLDIVVFLIKIEFKNFNWIDFDLKRVKKSIKVFQKYRCKLIL